MFFGVVCFGKDVQCMYNYECLMFIEVLLDQLYVFFMVFVEFIVGYEGQWNSLKIKCFLVLFYKINFEFFNVGKFLRELIVQFFVVLVQVVVISSDDIKVVIGIYDVSLGVCFNEISGWVILVCQCEGDVVNFDYIDNLLYVMKYDFEIINDFIIKIYDIE